MAFLLGSKAFGGVICLRKDFSNVASRAPAAYDRRAMRQLISLDAQFLALESSNQTGHVMSYCGHMEFGIVADRDQMPDLWSILDPLRDSLEELK
jgi:hypothetical protein